MPAEDLYQDCSEREGPGWELPKLSDDNPRDEENHGTMVADIAVGARFGVATLAKFIPVKKRQAACVTTIEGWNWLFNQIVGDWQAEKPRGNFDIAIINLSGCESTTSTVNILFTLAAHIMLSKLTLYA